MLLEEGEVLSKGKTTKQKKKEIMNFSNNNKKPYASLWVPVLLTSSHKIISGLSDTGLMFINKTII